MNKLPNEKNRLLSSSHSHTPDQESINSATRRKESVSPLKLYWRELTSGRYRLSALFLYSSIACLGSLLMGITIGYSSAINLKLPKVVGTNLLFSTPHPTVKQFQWFGMLLNIGALVGGPLAGLLSDRVGRKMTLVLGSVPCMVGWLLITYSFLPLATNGGTFEQFYTIFMIGRFFTGVGAGWYSLIVPVYAVEISPASLKGFFGSLPQLVVTIGLLVAYSLGTCLDYQNVALVVLGIDLLLVCLAAVVLEDTPRYLIARGRDEEAEKVLHKLYGLSTGASEELRNLKVAIKTNEEEGGLWQKIMLLKRKVILVPLVLSLLLMFYQQFSGVNAIAFYATNILTDANIADAAVVADFSIGVIQVIATLIAVLVVDYFGRKKLLVMGSIIMVASTGIMGGYFLFTNCICDNSTNTYTVFNASYCHHSMHCGSGLVILPILSLALFFIGFSLGWGPIPWFMMSELFPIRVRGILSGIATATNWTFSAIVTGTFLSYQNAVGNFFAFWTLSAILLTSIPIVILFLPETKGKDLKTIQQHFEKKYTTSTKILDDYRS